jgi:heme exporter protein C
MVLAAALALICVPVALVLAFSYAPVSTIALGSGGKVANDYPQKIFYLHVPIAFAAYAGFFVGAWNALLHLLRRRSEYDLRSYAGIHVGIVFGTLVLVTGSLWAKAAWGAWWNWGDRQLLVFLILYLYYAAYFMLRFSMPAGPARERASSVYALLGAALVPLSFLAIRIASTLIHPVVITDHGLQMTGPMAVTFVVSSVGFVCLAVWMMQIEATVKVRDLRAAAARAGNEAAVKVRVRTIRAGAREATVPLETIPKLTAPPVAARTVALRAAPSEPDAPACGASWTASCGNERATSPPDATLLASPRRKLGRDHAEFRDSLLGVGEGADHA